MTSKYNKGLSTVFCLINDRYQWQGSFFSGQNSKTAKSFFHELSEEWFTTQQIRIWIETAKFL